MTRYFIDVRDAHGTISDEEGSDYSDLEDALQEAKESARDVIHQYVRDRTPLGATCVEVRDEQGRVVAPDGGGSFAASCQSEL